MKSGLRIAIALCVPVLLLAWVAAPATAGDPAPIRIGAMPSMFPGGKPEFGAALKGPLTTEIEARTGLDSSVEIVLSTNAMRRKLNDGRLQFGLCHGYEFAWMQAKEPRLRPLMIAAPVHKPLKAFLVVADSHPAKSLCDLKGKVLARPLGVHGTVRVFADRKCKCDDKNLDELFEKVTHPENGETAIHDLFDNKADAALVDMSAMQCVEERFPARYRLVRVLMESAPFPMSVVAYREGAVEPAVLQSFEKGMKSARASRMGRQLMGLMRSGGFESVPEDYAKQIAAFLKDYPQIIREDDEEENK